MHAEHVINHLRNGRFVAILVTLLFISCSNRVPSELSWIEEVRLSDGRTIVVARSVGLRDDTTVGGPTEIATTRSEVRALEPADVFPPWSAPLLVQYLDVSPATNEWVLIAEAYSCDAWDAIGRPAYSTRVMYVVRDGRWVMQPLTDEFVGRKANMLVRVRQSQSYPDRRVTSVGKPASNQGAAPEALVMKPTPGHVTYCSGYRDRTKINARDESTHAEAAQSRAMYPLPSDATDFRHVAIQPGAYEQDTFVLSEPYPSVLALDHYRRVFVGWTECDYGGADWIEFEDASGSERRRVQQRARAWLSPTNDTLVIVALRYVHPLGDTVAGGAGSPQIVDLVRRTTRDAASDLKELGVTCGTGS
jgi:hypothetical protein